jgi:hypothetical protein
MAGKTLKGPKQVEALKRDAKRKNVPNVMARVKAAH